ncbi:MAG TPA: hypothetical protein VMS04_08320 [Vicinamibacterales bacterium]|nr:hypothetical protein [Vicinamibacterales bacterium]
MVIALAGRRIDASEATDERFPLAHVPLVADRLRALFVETAAAIVVSSAACGADLIALDVAGELRLERRIVLPFEARRFKAESVTDRPGDWGPMFDRVLAETRGAGHVTILDSGSGEAAYLAAAGAILDAAERLAKGLGSPAAAVIVWNGHSRGRDDLTAQFRDHAVARGFRVLEVLTN